MQNIKNETKIICKLSLIKLIRWRQIHCINSFWIRMITIKIKVIDILYMFSRDLISIRYSLKLFKIGGKYSTVSNIVYIFKADYVDTHLKYMIIYRFLQELFSARKSFMQYGVAFINIIQNRQQCMSFLYGLSLILMMCSSHSNWS